MQSLALRIKTGEHMKESVAVQLLVETKMKVLLFLALAILASAHAEEEEEHDYMYFPDDEGVPQLIDLATKLTAEQIRSLKFDSITYNLYTRESPSTPETLDFTSGISLRSSRFFSVRPTRIITHGWRSSQHSAACRSIIDAYLAVGDYNVIVVDWSDIADQLYVLAAGSVPYVAARISVMIDQLVWQREINYSSTKIIGHSLGGHIAGLAARNTIGTIQAVIALDPALPLYSEAGPGSRVDASDASHVQVIHTNGGLLGLLEPVGDTDFYPNGGRAQPGCGIDVTGACAHSRSYLYFAESILNPTGFPATGMGAFSGSILGRTHIFMGGRSLSTHARGTFTVTTRNSSPFAPN